MSTKKRQDELDRLKEIHEETIDALEKDDHPEQTGVLLSDEIKFYVDTVQLICPFNPDNLKPAAYELTVGDEAMVGGKFLSLSDGPEGNALRIPPFDVAVIKTAETLNLPRFLIGRWNIRTRWAYKGLVWVGGPQVDPGYVGHLFCPIYNLSNKEVRIRKGEAIAVFDFVKTTRFERNRGKEEWERYPRPPKRPVIEDFEIDDFRSGPFETKDKLDEVDQKISTFTSLVFVILAILMAAIGLPYLVGDRNVQSDIRTLDIVTFGFSLLATILSLTNWFVRRGTRSMALSLIVIVTAFVIVAVAIFFKIVFFPDDSIPWLF